MSNHATCHDKPNPIQVKIPGVDLGKSFFDGLVDAGVLEYKSGRLEITPVGDRIRKNVVRKHFLPKDCIDG